MINNRTLMMILMARIKRDLDIIKQRKLTERDAVQQKPI